MRIDGVKGGAFYATLVLVLLMSISASGLKHRKDERGFFDTVMDTVGKNDNDCKILECTACNTEGVGMSSVKESFSCRWCGDAKLGAGKGQCLGNNDKRSCVSGFIQNKGKTDGVAACDQDKTKRDAILKAQSDAANAAAKAQKDKENAAAAAQKEVKEKALASMALFKEHKFITESFAHSYETTDERPKAEVQELGSMKPGMSTVQLSSIQASYGDYYLNCKRSTRVSVYASVQVSSFKKGHTFAGITDAELLDEEPKAMWVSFTGVQSFLRSKFMHKPVLSKDEYDSYDTTCSDGETFDYTNGQKNYGLVSSSKILNTEGKKNKRVCMGWDTGFGPTWHKPFREYCKHSGGRVNIGGKNAESTLADTITCNCQELPASEIQDKMSLAKGITTEPADDNAVVCNEVLKQVDLLESLRTAMAGTNCPNARCVGQTIKATDDCKGTEQNPEKSCAESFRLNLSRFLSRVENIGKFAFSEEELMKRKEGPEAPQCPRTGAVGAQAAALPAANTAVGEGELLAAASQLAAPAPVSPAAPAPVSPAAPAAPVSPAAALPAAK